MSKADGKCDCAAHGPDECICGAWDDAQRTTRQIEQAVDAACTCGGGEPAYCCPACKVWHILYPSNVQRQPEPASGDRLNADVGTVQDGWRELEPDEEVLTGDKFFYPPSGRWCEHVAGATSLRTPREFQLRYIRSNAPRQPEPASGDRLDADVGGCNEQG